MDALRLAFDTLIVGALALPWLAIVLRIFGRGRPSGGPMKDYIAVLPQVPEGTLGALAGVMLIAVGYVLGASVSRVASDFFNDEFWHATPLPTLDEIREAVFCEQDEVQTIDWKRLPKQADDFKNGKPFLCEHGKRIDKALPFEKRDLRTKAQEAVLEAFRFQESSVLLAEEEKSDRLRQYNEQVMVLRGGAFNGIILCSLCFFGLCAGWRERLRGMAKLATFAPAALVLLVGVYLVVQAFRFSSET